MQQEDDVQKKWRENFWMRAKEEAAMSEYDSSKAAVKKYVSFQAARNTDDTV